jgi:hypothetical protein
MAEKRICKGDCIFCISKCPKCGSTDIEYRLAIVFHCENDTKNELDINAYVDPDISEATCNDCDYDFGYDDLEKIGLTMMRAYDIPPETVFGHNEDVTISGEGYRVEWGRQE